MPARSPELIEQIRVAYERNDTPTLVLSTLFGMSRGEIFALVRKHGWVARSSLPDQTPREKAIAVRAAEAAREVELYNGSATDVRVLRQRGFVVVREGTGFRVGNEACTFAQLEAKAARERRLLENRRLAPSPRSSMTLVTLTCTTGAGVL